MSRLARGALAFTEQRYSKSSDLCNLINSYGYHVGGFANSLRDQRTRLDPDPSRADNVLEAAASYYYYYY